MIFLNGFGGPGCSTEISIFYENGPYKFGEDGTLKENIYSWNQHANVLYVDVPLGSGFSTAGGDIFGHNYPKNSHDISFQFFEFILQWQSKYLDL